MKNNLITSIIALLLFGMLAMPAAIAQQADSSAQTENSESPDQSKLARAVDKLHKIKSAQADKRQQMVALLASVKLANETDRVEIEKQIDELRDSIITLEASFEGIAANGANLADLGKTKAKKLDWREELIDIARPVLNSLKEATEKPRKIGELRSAIRQYEQQIEQASKAINSIDQIRKLEMSPKVASELQEISRAWQDRRKDIERSLEVSNFELSSLDNDDIQVFEMITTAAREFIVGRGLTLLIAIFASMLIWYLMAAIRSLVTRWQKPSENSDHAARLRLLLYGYRFATIILMIVTVLAVFYTRGDLLLLSLTIIALVMLVLGAWRFLPRYMMEARLLLNVGAARQGERVIYQGLPFRISKLNLHSELSNPDLEGSIRLPLASLADLISRPHTNEEWFPSKVGDFLILPDGKFAEVLQQSVELVQLKIVNSIVQFRTVDFFQLNARNLSRDGFGVIVTFGIDYGHQSIALDTVPDQLKAGIQQAIEAAEFGSGLKNLLVEFKTAAASSLDYLIYASMQGEFAGSYYAIDRLIQQTCVDICNQQDWGIPFTQVTVHQAELAKKPPEDKSE